jgi:hypothetical protein
VDRHAFSSTETAGNVLFRLSLAGFGEDVGCGAGLYQAPFVKERRLI